MIDVITQYNLTILNDKDRPTYQHSLRVAMIVAEMAASVGTEQREIALMTEASLLHDVGKKAVPNYILQAPRRLSEIERSIVEEHACPSDLRELLDMYPPELQTYIKEAVTGHHSWVNGKGGYGDRALARKSVFVKLLAVADVYDALAYKRAYKVALSRDAITSIMDSFVAKGQLSGGAYSILKDVMPKLEAFHEYFDADPDRATHALEICAGRSFIGSEISADGHLASRNPHIAQRLAQLDGNKAPEQDMER